MHTAMQLQYIMAHAGMGQSSAIHVADLDEGKETFEALKRDPLAAFFTFDAGLGAATHLRTGGRITLKVAA